MLTSSNRKQKVFNPFKESVLPEYKINKDIDDLDSQKNRSIAIIKETYQNKNDDIESQEIYIDSHKSKDFSEMTAIINEQIKNDKNYSSLDKQAKTKKMAAIQKEHSKISFGNFKSQIFQDSQAK